MGAPSVAPAVVLLCVEGGRSTMQKNVEKTDAADEVQYADAVRYAPQYADGCNAKRPFHCDLFLHVCLNLVSSLNVCSTFPHSLRQRTDQKGRVS